MSDFLFFCDWVPIFQISEELVARELEKDMMHVVLGSTY